MRSFRTFLALIAAATAHGAAAQATESIAVVSPPAVVISAPPATGERAVSRQANPVGHGLLLYADTVETSRSLSISRFRQLFIRSEVNPRWYRAVYGGTQFFVRQADVALLDPSGPGQAGTRRVASKTER